MNRNFAAGALLAICLIGGIIAVSQIRYADPAVPDLQDMLHQPKTEMRMHLFGADRNNANGKTMSGKILGFDHYVDDGKTLYHSHNILETGGVEDIYLRPDGSKFMSKDYFPAQDPETAATLHSFATFAKDGKTYTSHDVKKEDGRLERSGRLLGSGLYQQTYFCDNGKTAQRVRLFDKDKNFLSEKLYKCDTGVLYAEVFPGSYSMQVKVNLLRPNGTRSAGLTKDYSGLSGDIFDEDGTTVIARMTNEYGSQALIFFDKNGKMRQVWTGSFGRYKIVNFDTATGLKTWSQEWKKHSELSDDLSGMMLVKVTEYAQDKENEAVRIIEMSNDGKVPVTVTTMVPGGFDFKSLKYPASVTERPNFEKLREQTRLIHSVDANGQVTKTELSILYQSWNNLVLPPDTMPTQIKIDPDLLKIPAAIELPKFNDTGPDRVYDYP